jgi:hypothetical protein
MKFINKKKNRKNFMNELRLAEDAIQTLRVFLKKPETEKN